eukprot:m.1441085 g.1441085  ORF g.1441085 m.1441085 type:complete len:104 (+) comp25094_c0_seq39:551-862(+)
MSPCLHSIIRKFFVNAFIRCCMQTPDIDVFGNYTCPLPPPMTEGPIIVGGIGDSGTRGVHGLIQSAFHVPMCPGSKCNGAGDNSLFFKFFGKGEGFLLPCADA